MIKVKCLVASFMLLAFVANANPVTQATAATVGGNYYNQISNKTASTLTLAYTERSSDGQAVYYVFNVNSNDGFVIVSAEDAGYPIIGYSTTGQYVIPTSGNNISFWMNRRKAEITAMRASNIQATTDVANTWNNYINNNTRNTHQTQAKPFVLPLLGKITWDQSPYYNAMCPGGSVTGCVATAMAQIMKYWSYPQVGLITSCYYDETAYGFTENYGQLCATYDTSHYIWSAMPNQLSSANKEVAKLMYDCGVSVDMDYSPSGSGSYVSGPAPSAQNSYVEYFNYDASTIASKMQSHYTTASWVSLIETELNNKRPVQYQGQDPNSGGHSWVCDGYDSTGKLHMNWGWSGYDNGYYISTSLTPTNSGYNFTEQIGALIGIEPPADYLAVAQVTKTTTVKVYPNPSNGIFNVELDNVTDNPQIAVYNVLGQQVYSTKLINNTTSINLSSQPKGIYLYRITSETGSPVSTGRLVVE